MLIQALRCLPRNAISRLAGWLAGLRWPGPLQRWQIRAFGRAVGVDFSEVRQPLSSFRSLQEFFTRELVEGARPIDAEPDALVSPCDGSWGMSGAIRDQILLQLKGRPYALADLLGSSEDAAALEGGAFVTLYLSPRDYHRFHAPCDVRVTRARYLPGSLWPVNRAGLRGVDGLFAQNERICAFMECRDATLCAVAVGATMVGKVRVCFDELSTNLAGAVRVERSYTETCHKFAKGQEWGRFEFGSSLVLLIPAGFARLEAHPPGTPVRLGQRIATLTDR